MARSLAARILLTTTALITGIGPYYADFNETHVYNPTWPGHAKFHNGQTMSMGAYFSIVTLWKTWLDDKDHLLTASIVAAGYFVTQLSAWFYPGATAFDPPLDLPVSFPQAFSIVPSLGIIALAHWLEQRSVADSKTKKV